MPYAVLIYETEQDFTDLPGLMPAYAAYAQALEAAGAYGQAIALATDPAVARFLQERASATGAGEPLRPSPDTPVQ
ncbi:MAG: hypothetical protein WBN80_12785 [Prochlorococcaceae cyanobacterium]